MMLRSAWWLHADTWTDKQTRKRKKKICAFFLRPLFLVMSASSAHREVFVVCVFTLQSATQSTYVLARCIKSSCIVRQQVNSSPLPLVNLIDCSHATGDVVRTCIASPYYKILLWIYIKLLLFVSSFKNVEYSHTTSIQSSQQLVYSSRCVCIGCQCRVELAVDTIRNCCVCVRVVAYDVAANHSITVTYSILFLIISTESSVIHCCCCCCFPWC